jgi:CRISPR system Cascade subunit CasE
MFLTQAISEKHHTTNPQYWHGMVFDFFPDSQKRDFLFFVDEDSVKTNVWILSKDEPTTPPWCSKVNTKRFEPKFTKGLRYRFNVLINPVENKTGGGTKYIEQKDVEQWFALKCKAQGFTVHEVLVGEMVRQQVIRAKSKGGAHTINQVAIEGWLEIDDASLFERAYTQGIGKSKAFGFGFLMLRRF